MAAAEDGHSAEDEVTTPSPNWMMSATTRLAASLISVSSISMNVMVDSVHVHDDEPHCAIIEGNDEHGLVGYLA